MNPISRTAHSPFHFQLTLTTAVPEPKLLHWRTKLPGARDSDSKHSSAFTVLITEEKANAAALSPYPFTSAG